ncbi:hypothetical protein AZA_13891 [Nitrospirillum viridazoti Y2]|nr:hypothetical protein AZA_13891 [Nitrospirillum amazonense Y2]
MKSRPDQGGGSPGMAKYRAMPAPRKTGTQRTQRSRSSTKLTYADATMLANAANTRCVIRITSEGGGSAPNSLRPVAK